MKKTIHAVLLLFTLCSFMPAFALGSSECKTKISHARAALLDFLNGEKGEAIRNRVRDTADAASVCLEALRVDPAKLSQLSEIRDLWTKFKLTREQDLVTLITAGKVQEARILATGVQKERLDRIDALFREIEGTDF